MFTHLIPILLLGCLVYADTFPYNSSFTPDHIRYLQRETKGLFKHAWTSYMEYGFPFDEVRPITCEPYGPNFNDITDTVRNDAMGNTSSTVLDNLDTLIIMEEWDELDFVLNYLKSNMDTIFEQDTIVQVFEMSIRSLGGLLSTHLLLTDVLNKKETAYTNFTESYDGFLLKMAHNLGKKLLPSYQTKTSSPLPRINLKHGLAGVPKKMQEDACTAGAITPFLELTLLSRLTGDPQFEHYTERTFWKLWGSKSVLNLMPMTLDPVANQWKDAISGIGASIDSFYEYAVKSWIVLNNTSMWNVFQTSYKALLTHSAKGGEGNGFMYFPNVGAHDGVTYGTWIDSLSAFWPGLQVLAGQLDDAIRTHWLFLKIWNKFDSIPERWIYLSSGKKSGKKKNRVALDDPIALEWYPLRPEFIESTYFLYRATKDPMYLQIGTRVLELLQTRYKAPCGFSGFQDVRTGKMQNRMETFVMGETLKYLYLLFDVYDDSFLHNSMDGKNWVFSTEAHPIWLPRKFDPESSKKPEPIDIERLEKWFPKSQKDTLNFETYSMRKKKLSSRYDTFILDTSLPLALDFDLPNDGNFHHVVKRDPFVDRFETCPIFTRGEGIHFLHSRFYQWNQIFDADNVFERTLVKPRYMEQSSLDGSTIELTKSFYDKFSMIMPSKDNLFLQSPSHSTTHKYEVFIGDIKDCNSIEISRLIFDDKVDHEKEYLVQEGDLWIPELRSLRVTFEELKVGRVDSESKLINQEYIDSIVEVNENGDTETNSILRILRVNGLHVSPGTIIWSLQFSTGNQPDFLDIQSDGRVKLEGKVVENLVVVRPM